MFKNSSSDLTDLWREGGEILFMGLAFQCKYKKSFCELKLYELHIGENGRETDFWWMGLRFLWFGNYGLHELRMTYK
jgi:hypothetical protein